MSNLTTQELKHLEKLSCVKIDESQESVFLDKLDSVIIKLQDLNKINTDNINIESKGTNHLRPLGGINNFEGKGDILKNSKHDIINNSIIIKSTLSN